jgi:hypothetical protein
MREQAGPGGQPPDKRTPDRPRFLKFALHGSEKDDKGKDKDVEYPITPIVEAGQLDIGVLAKEFIRELDRSPGHKRVEQSAWQNKITRSIMMQKVGNHELFLKDLKNECNRLGRQVTKEIQTAFDGIYANIEAIKRIMAEYDIDRASPDERLMIGMNDNIDAGDKVDLVEIRYHERAGERPLATKVRLVQTKRSEVTPTEDRAIIAAHRDYFGRLFGPEKVAGELLEKDVRESVRSGLEFERGMEAAPSPEGRVEFLTSYFGNFILDYLSESGPAGKDAVSETLKSCRNCPPSAILKLFFDEKVSRELFVTIAESIWTSDEERSGIDRAYQRLRVWAAANPPTHEELKTLRPDWVPPPTLLDTAAFESVIYHGGKKIVRPLGSRKALTRK